MSEPIHDSNFFLFTLSPTTPTHTSSPTPCTPHLFPPAPLSTPIPHSFLGWILEWGLGMESVWYCVWESCTRENEKETQEEGNWERKKGGQKQMLKRAFCLVAQVHCKSYSRDTPHSVSHPSDPQSNLHLSNLSYSVLWSKRLIRGKVQHQKDLDSNGSSVTYKPLTLAKLLQSVWDFLIYKLDVTAQYPTSPWRWNEMPHVKTVVCWSKMRHYYYYPWIQCCRCYGVWSSFHQMSLDLLEKGVGVTVWNNSETELYVLGGKLAFKIALYCYF